VRKVFLAVLVILGACTGKEEVPENLLTKEQMIEVLTEIHLLEAKIQHISLTPRDTKQYVYEHFQQKLFDELEITTEQYEQSLAYYFNDPIQLEKIYITVVDSLMQKEKIGK
jgi:hypothetical protein